MSKAALVEQINTLKQSIQDLEKRIVKARQRKVPWSNFYIRLQRLHKRIANPEPAINSSHQIRLSTSILESLLSLPVPRLLDKLAHHLLTTSLPITEQSFHLMIQKLSSLRLGSAARSAYHSLIAAGHSPSSPRAISLLLKLAPTIDDRKEFVRLQSLIKKSNISCDA